MSTRKGALKVAAWLLVGAVVGAGAGSTVAYQVGIAHQRTADSTAQMAAFNAGRAAGQADNRVTDRDRQAFDACMAYYTGQAGISLNADGCFGDAVMSWQK